MNWTLEYLPEAEDDLKKLDGSVKAQVVKGIRKVLKNPLSKKEGGYGDPLGNRSNNDLTGLLKIKYLKIGIRVVYKTVIIPDKNIMKVIVISARGDNEVYDLAGKRRTDNKL
jgi:mRNA interferase RelE/StbE